MHLVVAGNASRARPILSDPDIFKITHYSLSGLAFLGITKQRRRQAGPNGDANFVEEPKNGPWAFRDTERPWRPLVTGSGITAN